MKNNIRYSFKRTEKAHQQLIHEWIAQKHINGPSAPEFAL